MEIITTRTVLLDAMSKFVEAGEQLNTLWNLFELHNDKQVLHGDYPNYLPSFDELVSDLRQWYMIAGEELIEKELKVRAEEVTPLLDDALSWLGHLTNADGFDENTREAACEFIGKTADKLRRLRERL